MPSNIVRSMESIKYFTGPTKYLCKAMREGFVWLKIGWIIGQKGPVTGAGPGSPTRGRTRDCPKARGMGDKITVLGQKFGSHRKTKN